MAASKQLGEPATEERPQSRHGTADDGEVDLDGGPDIRDVVLAELFSEV